MPSAKDSSSSACPCQATHATTDQLAHQSSIAPSSLARSRQPVGGVRASACACYSLDRLRALRASRKRCAPCTPDFLDFWTSFFAHHRGTPQHEPDGPIVFAATLQETHGPVLSYSISCICEANLECHLLVPSTPSAICCARLSYSWTGCNREVHPHIDMSY